MDDNIDRKPCNQIGATKMHTKAREDDVIYTAFIKAYRRMSARAHKNKMTTEEFIKWLFNLN